VCYLTATKEEHQERFSWWICELESLGLSIKKLNEFNDLGEMRDLAEDLKQGFYQDHKTDNLHL
jgi:hypothetical protein